MTELERFFAKVQSTPTLRQQIDSVPRTQEAFVEEVLRIAGAHGFQLTVADLQQQAPLTDGELSKVTGGVLIGGGAKQQPKTFADYWYQIFYA